MNLLYSQYLFRTRILRKMFQTTHYIFFRFGQSLGGSLVLGNIAVPHPKVIEVGSFLSTFGAGLQSLTGSDDQVSISKCQSMKVPELPRIRYRNVLNHVDGYD